MNAVRDYSTNPYSANTDLISDTQNKHKLSSTEANKTLDNLVSSSTITSDQETDIESAFQASQFSSNSSSISSTNNQIKELQQQVNNLKKLIQPYFPYVL